MPASVTYKLPGVYSKEVTGPQLGVTTGGNATVAFIGPALGYRTATQTVNLVDTEAVALNYAGAAITSVISARNGRSYSADDYDFSTDNNTIARKVTVLSESTAAQSMANQTHLYDGVNAFAVPGLTDGKSIIDGTLDQITGTVPESAIGDVPTWETTTAPTTSGSNNTWAVSAFDLGTGDVIRLYDLVAYNDNLYPVSSVDDESVITGLALSSGDLTRVYVVDIDFTIVEGSVVFGTGSVPVNGESLKMSYYVTSLEGITINGTNAIQLKHLYVSKDALTGPVTLVVGQYSSDAIPVFSAESLTEGEDYTVDYDTGRISFQRAMTGDYYVNYGYCAIRSGENVYVSYQYTDEGYFDAQYCDSYSTFAATFGNPWDTEGNIVSPISMGAYIATRNGMVDCYGVAVAPVEAPANTGGSAPTYPIASWQAAFDALSVVNDVDIIVPLSGEQAVWDLALEHINIMKENEDERIAIIGADGTENLIDSATLISYAEGYDNDDIWMVAPSTFKFLNPVNSVVNVVPAYYAAAAVAGYNSSVPQYTPLTHKNISGMYSANEYNTKVVKKNESANGLMYIDEVNGRMRILHGRTTSTDSILEQESNIVLTKYYIIKQMRDLFDSGYIGSPMNNGMLMSIKAAAQSLLCSLRDSGYIYAYNYVNVSPDSVNPTQVNVTFEYQPTYSINYIEITFSIDTGTIA